MAASAKPSAETVPRMLGRYHVLEELARVPLGATHLARYEGSNGFQRWSSVLWVEPRLAADRAFRDAFFEAARRAVRIQHPNVELTLDVGETDGVLWQAHDYLLSETVDDLLRMVGKLKVPVPWDIACRIVADAALGLDAIHEGKGLKGVVATPFDGRLGAHRFAVTYDGPTKLLQPCFPDAAAVRAPDPRALAYTAPEILWGEAVDRRADIFSLGVVLWELCAGRSLFEGRDEEETRAFIQANKVPSLRKIVASVPAAVEEVVLRALKPNPERRFESAKSLARTLQAVLVKEALVVTDDDVGRYLLSVFAERFREKEERLSAASEITEVYERDGDEATGVAVAGDVSGPTQIFASPTAPTQVFSKGGSPPPSRGPKPKSEPPGKRARPPSPPPPVSDSDLADTGEQKTRLKVESNDPVTLSPKPPPSMRMRAASNPATVPPKPPAPPPPPSTSPPSSRAPAMPSWPVQHVQPVPPGYPRAPTMPMPIAGAMLGAVPMATPQPARHYASSFPPPAPAYATPPPPVAGTSGAVTMPPPRASGMSPALLFIALGLSLAVLAVLVVVRFRKHDDFAIAIPTASSAAAAPSASESLEPAVDMEVDMTDAETAAIAAASGTTSTAAGSNPGGGARVRRTTRSPETRRVPSTRETTPPPPATTAGGKGLLTVVCVPACDEVVDGRASLGPSPIFKRPASLGPHRIVLRIHDPPMEKVVDVVVGADDVTVIRQPMAR